MSVKVAEAGCAFFNSSGNPAFHILIDRTGDNNFISVLSLLDININFQHYIL